MTAKRPKSLHEKRKVTFAELIALYGTRAMLQEKVLTFNKYRRRGDSFYPAPHEHEFNMAVVCRQNECGTVGCIGGTMGIVLGLYPMEYVAANNSRMGRLAYPPGLFENHPTRRSAALHDLFFPPEKYAYSTITPQQAVKAINNWLKTGKPMWAKVLTKRNVWKDLTL